MHFHDGLTPLLAIHDGANDAVYNAQPRTTDTNCNLRDARSLFYEWLTRSIERAIDDY